MKNKWELDRENNRIVAFLPDLAKSDDFSHIQNVFREESLGKLIIHVLEPDKDILKHADFRLEGELSGFFNGNKAFVYTKYGEKEREISTSKTENENVLSIVHKDNKDLTQLQLANFKIELVEEEDLEDLVNLFKVVFQVYPTDIFNPNYLRKVMFENYTFMLAKTKDGEIVGVASAMDSGYGSAEITDCAVHPDYRGNQLLHGIILGLEKELVNQGIYHAYSLTRAKSVGMNMTVKRLGYHYEGTLINNCIISTGFEDMNIWTKSLRKNSL